MITTTLNKIRNYGPCTEGWKTLLAHLGKTTADDEPLSLLTILESNGVADTIWCLRTLPEHNSKWRHFAVDCAERVNHLMQDARSVDALRVARLHADGLATDEQLSQAYKEAYAVASAAHDAAYYATHDAAAAHDAAYYAAASATASAYAAATAASADAAYAAGAAYDAAGAHADRYAEREWQANRLKWYIS